ncbi:MAG: hypothetical protein D3905_11780, partial [Candidatus Electrothrix sp. AS4_5]|nr:hypothetical protein [Candidatus Electrothrix gigas]
GVPDTAAEGDDNAGTDDEGNGITATPSGWTEGTKGGSVDVTVTGSGWLVAWIDFDGDGSFSTHGEMIVSMAVEPPAAADPADPYIVDGDPDDPGIQLLKFDIPTGTFGASQGYARFRLFPEKPAIPEISYKGTADNGEVEDMRFDFGTGTIGDRIWLDENSDGVQDVGEAGISGVTVYIDDDGTPGYSAGDTQAVTDSNGNYLFKGVPTGTYTVQVDASTLPAGLELIFDEDDNTTTPDGETTVTLITGGEHLTADFGYNFVTKSATDNPAIGDTGAIGDRIWNDADGDGIQDAGEVGIVGVTVKLLTDDNNDGVYDVESGTTTTGADGRYIFDDLPPGSYVVEVTSPTGTTQTGDPDQPGVTATSADNKTTSPVILAPGDVFVNADFGYQYSGGHSIGDTIYLDTNADGAYDSAVDTGIAGVSVVLEDGSGNILATAVTNADGEYRFDGLPDGDYTVKVADNANLLDGLSITADPDATKDGKSTVTLSGDDLDQDFGYTLTGHSSGEGLIGDTIFLDSGDGSGGVPDGIYNAGEGIEGVTVRLYDSIGSLVGMAVTDANGHYEFGNLDKTATYEVRVDTDTLPNGGVGLTNSVDPDNDGTLNRSTVDLSDDPDGTDDGINIAQDFGYVADLPNTISGTIWNDSNADGELTDGTSGMVDETGKGIVGVTIALYEDLNDNGKVDGEDRLVGTIETDSNGDYSFTNLPEGDYLVDVTDEDNLLDGYWHSVGPDAGDGSTDNNSQEDTYTVTVSSGTTNTTADFGYYKDPASVGNLVWNDVNGDGIYDADGLDNILNTTDDETGIDDAVVTATVTYGNGATFTITTKTKDGGEYSFNLLLDEDYSASTIDGDPATATEPQILITVTAPTGMISTHTSTTDSPDVNDNADNPTDEPADVVQGGSDLTNDFGYRNPIVSGNVSADTNNDGNGDTNLDNITVELFLDTNGDGVADTPGSPTASTTTNGSGEYSFIDVTPGQYIVVETDGTTYPDDVSDSDGTANGTDSDTIKVNLTTTDNTGNNFVDENALVISGNVSADTNNDGNGDTNLDNITVELFLDTNGDGVADTPGSPTA